MLDSLVSLQHGECSYEEGTGSHVEVLCSVEAVGLEGEHAQTIDVDRWPILNTFCIVDAATSKLTIDIQATNAIWDSMVIVVIPGTVVVNVVIGRL